MSLSASVITVGGIGYVSTGMTVAAYYTRKGLDKQPEGYTPPRVALVAVFIFVTIIWPVWLLARFFESWGVRIGKTKFGRKLAKRIEDSDRVLRLGCYGPRVAIFILFLAAAFVLATAWTRHLPWEFRAAGELLVLAFSFFRFSPALAHDKRLCERCMGTVPLDGWAEAEKRKRVLAAYHWEMRTPQVFVVLVLALLTTVLMPVPYNSFVIAAALVFWGVHAYVRQAHRDLYPWCPYCHDGDDGDDGFWPQTDPAGDQSLTR